MEDGKTPADFDYNVKITRQVVELAHPQNVSVEGELGCLGGLGELGGLALAAGPGGEGGGGRVHGHPYGHLPTTNFLYSLDGILA